MTKLISTKPIIFRVIAPLALGLILFSGVNGWGGDKSQTNNDLLKDIKALKASGVPITVTTQTITLGSPGKPQAGQPSTGSSPTVNDNGANMLNTTLTCTGGEISKDVSATSTTNHVLHHFDSVATADINKYNAMPDGAGMVAKLVRCQANVDKEANKLTANIDSVNKSMTTKICAYQTKSLLHPVGAVEASKNLADASGDFAGEVAGLGAHFQNDFGAADNPAGMALKKPGQKSTSSKNDGYNLCQSECVGADNLQSECVNVAKAFGKEIGTLELVAMNEGNGAHHTWTAVKVGIGLAAVGGVVAVVNAIHRHNDANKRAKVANAYNNGILTNADGTTTDCTTAQNYLTEACQPVLMHYCTETQHAGGTGCQTFQSSYCALSTSNASYCLAGAAATYCQSYSGSSPACQWMAARPASCQANPYDQSCLTSLSNSQLATQCSSYPNDPLCQAFTQGKVVNQAGAANIAMNPLTNTTTAPSTDPALTAPVASFNQLIDTGSTSSASTSPTSTDGTTNSAIPSPTNTNTGGLTVRAQVRGQPVANLWAANSGTTVAALCGESGCH